MENKKSEIIKELIQGELSATETYKQALQKFSKDQPMAAQELQKIEAEHEKAVEILKQKFPGNGDVPHSSGVWGTFSKAVEGTAKVFGNKAAIKALKEGEELGIREYEKALKEPELDPDFKQLISTTLLPQTRSHLPVLDRFMQA